MSVALENVPNARTMRLSTLVTASEAEQIARRASAAGLSVSAYLRERALLPDATADDPEAIRRVDALIDGMHREVDGAIAAVRTTLEHLSRP